MAVLSGSELVPVETLASVEKQKRIGPFQRRAGSAGGLLPWGTFAQR
jgi:hypothetical protein